MIGFLVLLVGFNFFLKQILVALRRLIVIIDLIPQFGPRIRRLFRKTGTKRKKAPRRQAR